MDDIDIDELAQILSNIDDHLSDIKDHLDDVRGRAIATAENTRWPAAVIVVLVLIAYFLFLPDITGRTRGSYPAVRRQDGSFKPLDRTMYKANPLTQTVIYWMPGTNDINETPFRLVDCVVRDTKNWVGYYPSGGAVEMRKGRIVEHSRKQDPVEIYLRWSHWWFRRALTLLRDE